MFINVGTGCVGDAAGGRDLWCAVAAASSSDSSRDELRSESSRISMLSIVTTLFSTQLLLSAVAFGQSTGVSLLGAG